MRSTLKRHFSAAFHKALMLGWKFQQVHGHVFFSPSALLSREIKNRFEAVRTGRTRESRRVQPANKERFSVAFGLFKDFILRPRRTYCCFKMLEKKKIIIKNK